MMGGWLQDGSRVDGTPLVLAQTADAAALVALVASGRLTAAEAAQLLRVAS